MWVCWISLWILSYVAMSEQVCLLVLLLIMWFFFFPCWYEDYRITMSNFHVCEDNCQLIKALFKVVSDLTHQCGVLIVMFCHCSSQIHFIIVCSETGFQRSQVFTQWLNKSLVEYTMIIFLFWLTAIFFLFMTWCRADLRSQAGG